MFGLMRFLQNRYFLAILLYRKHHHVYPKEKQQPFTSYKTTWIHHHKKQIYAFQNKNLLRRQSTSRSYFRFYFGTQGKKNCFVVYDFFEHEDNFLVDRENHISAGLLVRTLWSFCVVFDVASFVTSLVYDALWCSVVKLLNLFTCKASR